MTGPRRTTRLGSLLVLLLVTGACTGPSHHTPSAPVSPTCLPFQEPRTLANLNAVVAGYRDVPEFRGGDVGAEVQLVDGRRVWVFGDTLRGGVSGPPTVVRNSMLVFGTGCVSAVTGPGGGAVVPDRADGVGYWPMSIVDRSGDGGDRLLVFYQRVRGTEQAGRFVTLGPALAEFRVPRGGPPVLRRLTELGPDQPDQTARTWGAATWDSGDDVYLYGTANPRKPYVFGYSLAAARAPFDRLGDRSTWQYWDGTRWQASASRATDLIPARGGVSQTLSVIHHGSSWYAVSKRDDFLGTDLVLWQSSGPAGPFRAGPAVAAIPSDFTRRRYQYMPLAHPDLLPASDSLVVSVCQNTDNLQELFANPLLYRPRFIQVPLPHNS